MSTTYKDLVTVAAEVTGGTKTQAEQVLDAVFARIVADLKAGEEVVIKDFGRFSSKVRPGRAGRNPKTGEAIQIAEKTVFKFTPRGELK